MQFIRLLMEKGKFKPLIDRTYSLEQISEAYKYVNTGQKTGSVIISIEAKQ
jgi:D-arabinose 1-dehydrogenase-like Zn-dependent alcohol dehydrogenase